MLLFTTHLAGLIWEMWDYTSVGLWGILVHRGSGLWVTGSPLFPW